MIPAVLAGLVFAILYLEQFQFLALFHNRQDGIGDPNASR
jgi:hypothetical protein